MLKFKSSKENSLKFKQKSFIADDRNYNFSLLKNVEKYFSGLFKLIPANSNINIVSSNMIQYSKVEHLNFSTCRVQQLNFQS